MKPAFLIPLCLLVFLPVIAASQGPIDPGEPEIVLPQVILEIEDVSVENVQATLPPEEELLPPERQASLPAVGEIAVGEPSIPAPESGAEQVKGGERALAVDALLGAGTESTILGKLNVKTLGRDPRVSLSFSHQNIDGFSGHSPGSGYDTRSDELGADLKARVGPFDLGVKGNFHDGEDGMQGEGPFISRLSRTAGGSVGVRADALDWLSVGGSMEAGLDTFILTGDSPLSMDETRLSPGLCAEARFDPVKIGLSTRFTVRNADYGVDDVRDQKARIGLSISVELPSSMLLEGSAAWWWDSEEGSLFPFEVRFSGAPFGSVAFGVGAGYKVQSYAMADILSACPLFVPRYLIDDHGWFADSTLTLSVAKDLAFNAAAFLMESREMPDAAGSTSATQDPGTGLFTLTQRSALRFSSDLGIRWNAVPGLTLGAGWKHQYLKRPAFVARDELTAEAIVMEKSGAYGADASFTLRMGAPFTTQLPDVGIGGFVRISDVLQMRVDVKDILQPALDGPRESIDPFEEPGFRVIAGARLSF